MPGRGECHRYESVRIVVAELCDDWLAQFVPFLDLPRSVIVGNSDEDLNLVAAAHLRGVDLRGLKAVLFDEAGGAALGLFLHLDRGEEENVGHRSAQDSQGNWDEDDGDYQQDYRVHVRSEPFEAGSLQEEADEECDEQGGGNAAAHDPTLNVGLNQDGSNLPVGAMFDGGEDDGQRQNDDA